MNHTTNRKYILIILILAIVIGGGILSYCCLVQKEAGTPQIKLLGKPDLTADCKTYRSEEYGFEVKYPGDWGYTRFSYPEFLVGFGSPPPSDIGGGHAGKFSIQILDTPSVNVVWKKSSFEDFFQSQIIIDSVRATKTKATWPKDSINPGEQQVQVVLEHSGKTFLFLYALTDNQDVKLFDQILSTFKFIE